VFLNRSHGVALAIWSLGALVLSAVAVALGAPLTVGRGLGLLGVAGLLGFGLLRRALAAPVVATAGADPEADRRQVASRLLTIQRTRQRDDTSN
jgi:hypothetical protein